MKFDRKLTRPILAGKKVETRRPVKDGEAGCRYRPGHTYAIEVPRTRYVDGKPRTVHETIGRIRVTAVRDETLGELTERGVLAEGFKSRREFLDWWTDTYGRASDGQRVWVIRFELDREQHARYLAAAGGYTSDVERAMGAETATTRDGRGRRLEPEPEALDAPTLDRLAAENRARFDQDHRAERDRQQARSRAAVLREVETRARHRGVDIDLELERIERELAEIRRKVDRAA